MFGRDFRKCRWRTVLAMTVIGLAFFGIFESPLTGNDVLLAQPHPGRPATSVVARRYGPLRMNITHEMTDGATSKDHLTGV
jgi:hypothetical protein